MIENESKFDITNPDPTGFQNLSGQVPINFFSITKHSSV